MVKGIIAVRNKDIEDWDLIFSIVHNCTVSEVHEHKRTEKSEELLELLHKYKGDNEYNKKLINLYDQLKFTISIPYLDSMLIESLENSHPLFIVERVQEVFYTVDNPSEFENNSSDFYQRMINNLKEFYVNTKNEYVRELFEKTFIDEIKKHLVNFLTSINCCKAIFNLLYEISLQINDTTYFDSILSIMERYYEELVASKPEADKRRSSQYNIEAPLIILVHKHLENLFKFYYTEYPPDRLLRILKALMKNLNSKNLQLVKVTLNFFNTLTYDDDHCLLHVPSKVPSYVCGWEIGKLFETALLIESVVKCFHSINEVELIEDGVNIAIRLAKSHYGLYKANIIIDVLTVLNKSIEQKKLIIASKVAQLLYLILLQRDRTNKDIKLTLIDFTTVFAGVLEALKKIREKLRIHLEMSKREEIKSTPKEKKWKVKEYTRLIKILMTIIQSAIYIYKEQLLIEPTFIIEILKITQGYIDDAVVIEMLVEDIQEIIFATYYSGLIHGFNNELLLSFVEVILKIGFRNLYFAQDSYVPVLIEYLKNKQEFPIKKASGWNSNNKISNDEPKLIVNTLNGNIFSILGNSNTDLSPVIYLNTHKIHEFFKYQNDNTLAIHNFLEQILQFLNLLETTSKNNTVLYITKLIDTEFKFNNKKNPIERQLNVLKELMIWITSTDLIRFVHKLPSPNKGDFWLTDNGVLQIIVQGNVTKIIMRNATYVMMEEIKIKNMPLVSDVSSKKTLSKIKEIGKVSEEKSNKRGNMTYERFMDLLPVSFQSVIGHKKDSLKRGLFDNKLRNNIKELDSINVYSIHSVGVLYLAKDCIMLSLL